MIVIYPYVVMIRFTIFWVRLTLATQLGQHPRLSQRRQELPASATHVAPEVRL